MKEYLRSIRALPLSVKWFLITEMLFGLSTGIWNVNANFHLQARGLSELNIGTMLAAGSIATAVISLVAGSFCSRFGFRPGMVLGCFIKGSGMVIMGIAPHAELIFLGQLLFGIGDAFILSSEFPFLLGLVKEEYRHICYNLLICSYLFAMFFGNISGGTLYKWLPKLSTVYAFPVILSGVLFITLGLGRSLLPKKKVDIQARGISLSILREQKVLWFLLYGVLGASVFYIFSSMINLIYKNVFHLQEETIGFIFSIGTALSCVSVFLLPMMIARWKAANIASLVLTVISCVCLMMSFVGVQMYIFLAVSRTFLGTMLPGSVDSLMLQSIPQAQQGYYSGMRIFANSVGLGIGGCLSGFLLSYSNYSILMLAGAIVSFIQVAVYQLRCRKFLAEV